MVNNSCLASAPFVQQTAGRAMQMALKDQGSIGHPTWGVQRMRRDGRLCHGQGPETPCGGSTPS
eukprot:8244166-Pyramimonas_sp.AAC.1